MSPQPSSFVGYIENYGTLEFVTKGNIYSFGQNKTYFYTIALSFTHSMNSDRLLPCNPY